MRRYFSVPVTVITFQIQALCKYQRICIKSITIPRAIYIMLNGLQGRDGKAIVTVQSLRRNFLRLWSNGTITQITGFDDDTCYALEEVVYGTIRAPNQCQVNVLEYEQLSIFETCLPGLSAVTPSRDQSCHSNETLFNESLYGDLVLHRYVEFMGKEQSHRNSRKGNSLSQRESRKKGIEKILSKDHIMSKTTHLGMTRTLHEPTYGREGLLTA
ncbi:hypothetical protein IW262DRAFT_1483018 [Armillaria fumosa]|nr:hypothetical protein IW262DRAFT_1483018 [Armillaria fumosa]